MAHGSAHTAGSGGDQPPASCDASATGNLGLLAAEREQKDEACELLKEAAAIYEETGAGGENPDKVRAKLQELGCE